MSLYHVIDPSQLCCGRVGIGDKICLKASAHCEIVSQWKNKHNIPSSSFLCLKGVGSDVGHISLSLDTDGLDSELIEDLLGSTKDDWATIFGRLKTNSSKTVPEASKAAA